MGRKPYRGTRGIPVQGQVVSDKLVKTSADLVRLVNKNCHTHFQSSEEIWLSKNTDAIRLAQTVMGY